MFRKLTPFLLTTVPALFALGLVRAVALLRRGTGATSEAIGALFIWQSTSLTVAKASVLGLFARKAAFLRTPKTNERARWWQALKANWAESALALLGAAGIAGALSKPTAPSGLLLAGLLFSPRSAWPRHRTTAGPPGAPRCRRNCASGGAAVPSRAPGLRHGRGSRRVRHRLVRGDRDRGADARPAPPGVSAPFGWRRLGRQASLERPAGPSRPGQPRRAPRREPGCGASTRPGQAAYLPSSLSSYLQAGVSVSVLSDLPSSLP